MAVTSNGSSAGWSGVAGGAGAPASDLAAFLTSSAVIVGRVGADVG